MSRVRSVAGALAGMMALAMAVLWWMGGTVAEYQSEVMIGAAPERVYPFLTQPGKLKLWIGGLVDSQPIGDAVLRVGARSRETVEENGQREEMITEITGFEPGRLLEVRISSGSFEGSNRFVLDAATGGTHITQTLRFRLKGFARLLSPFLKGTVQRKLDSDLQQLKRTVEASGA